MTWVMTGSWGVVWFDQECTKWPLTYFRKRCDWCAAPSQCLTPLHEYAWLMQSFALISNRSKIFSCYSWFLTIMSAVMRSRVTSTPTQKTSQRFCAPTPSRRNCGRIVYVWTHLHILQCLVRVDTHSSCLHDIILTWPILPDYNFEVGQQ